MKKTSISAALLLSALTLSAADVYVSPSGLDSNDGTASSPKATLTSALRQAREMRRTKAPGVESGITIHMAPGTYLLRSLSPSVSHDYSFPTSRWD